MGLQSCVSRPSCTVWWASLIAFLLSIKLPLKADDLAGTINISRVDIWGLSSTGNLREKSQDLCTPTHWANHNHSHVQSAWLPWFLAMPRRPEVLPNLTEIRAGLAHPVLLPGFKQRQSNACASLWEDSGVSLWPLVFHDCGSPMRKGQRLPRLADQTWKWAGQTGFVQVQI